VTTSTARPTASGLDESTRFSTNRTATIVSRVPATRSTAKNATSLSPNRIGSSNVSSRCLTHSLSKALAVDAVEQTDEHNVHEPRLRTDGIHALFEGMPHVPPGGAVLARGGMEARLGHDDRESDADQDHAQRAELERQRHIVRADQGGKPHADERGEQTDLRGADKEFVGFVLADLVRDPRLCCAGGEGVAQTPDDLRKQDGQKGREEPLDEETEAPSGCNR
jgi:hypothetical protein